MRNESLLDTEQSQRVALQLRNATQHTASFFGSDIKVAYHLSAQLLKHESTQEGFGLAATQDVHFTEVILWPQQRTQIWRGQGSVGCGGVVLICLCATWAPKSNAQQK